MGEVCHHRSSSLGGAAGRKGKHRHIPLWCVISCDAGVSAHLLSESVREVYAISSTQGRRLAPHKNEGICTVC